MQPFFAVYVLSWWQTFLFSGYCNVGGLSRPACCSLRVCTALANVTSSCGIMNIPLCISSSIVLYAASTSLFYGSQFLPHKKNINHNCNDLPSDNHCTKSIWLCHNNKVYIIILTFNLIIMTLCHNYDFLFYNYNLH